MWEKTSLKHVVPDAHGNPIKVRSKLEIGVAKVLNETQVKWQYETVKIKYKIPESDHTYNPDFILPNGIHIEGKGRLSDYQERYKYQLVKKQYPELDLRFIFDNPNKLVGGTKQTHGAWAEKIGFPYCSVKDHDVIKSWVEESNGSQT